MNTNVYFWADGRMAAILNFENSCRKILEFEYLVNS